MLSFLREAPASWLSDVQNHLESRQAYTIRSMIIGHHSTRPGSSTPRVRGVDLCIIIVHHSPL